MGKLVLFVDGCKKYFRVTRPYCPNCQALMPMVVINRKSLPPGKHDLLSGRDAVEVCLGCLESGYYASRRELIYKAILRHAVEPRRVELPAAATGLP